MDYKKRSMLLRRATKVRWTVLGGEDEPEIINIHDITQTQDDSDSENFVSQVLVGALLENTLFRLLIMVVVVSNCLIIAFQTNSVIAKKYDITFSVFEQIILTVFVWEILVKWYYGFNIFWKNGWNILDCCVTTALIMAPLLFPDEDASFLKVIRVLRVIRSVRGFASIQGVSMMVQVIVQSVPDMANIFLLLMIIMLIFAVFGVTLFSAAVPSAFGDLSYALYTLFICITQDGWMSIYKEFQDGEEGLKYGASFYFFVFLTGGAFIFANLLVAVVTTNLEICMADRDEKNADTMTSLLPDDTVGIENQSMIHVEDVVAKTSMISRQKPWKGSCMENLTADTFEELVLIQAAMRKNLVDYREIRKELDSIIEQVVALSVNQEQEQELLMRSQQAASLQESLLKNEVATGRTGDMLSTLMTLEKANIIDSTSDSTGFFQKGLRHAVKRLSLNLDNSSSRASHVEEQEEHEHE